MTSDTDDGVSVAEFNRVLLEMIDHQSGPICELAKRLLLRQSELDDAFLSGRLADAGIVELANMDAALSYFLIDKVDGKLVVSVDASSSEGRVLQILAAGACNVSELQRALGWAGNGSKRQTLINNILPRLLLLRLVRSEKGPRGATVYRLSGDLSADVSATSLLPVQPPLTEG